MRGEHTLAHEKGISSWERRRPRRHGQSDGCRDGQIYESLRTSCVVRQDIAGEDAGAPGKKDLCGPVPPGCGSLRIAVFRTQTN